MKKKLIIGLGMISVIFILSGLFILWNLVAINSGERLMDRLDEIGDRENEIIHQINSVQTELYRRQAGYSSDKENLLRQIVQMEKELSVARSEFASNMSKTECNTCHVDRAKFDSGGKRLEEAGNHLKAYSDTVRLILDSHDNRDIGTLEAKAAYEGEALLLAVGDIKHATTEARIRMEAALLASVSRSRNSIIFAVLLGVLLSAATGLILLKSITRPMEKLVAGIEKVSAGEYGSKVQISSRDEIGFLARTFNSMTDNLAKSTAQKEALMAELRDLNSHLEVRINEATEQLKVAHERMLRSETLSAVGTFASGVAHELATPLSSVLSYFQMVKGAIPAEGGLADDISIIEGELVRCRTILRGMLDFAGPQETEKSATNLNTLLSGLLALVKYQTEYKKVRIVGELDSSIPDIMAVPGQLKQVFLNIILNALQAMPEGGILTVSTSSADNGGAGKVLVRISDTGTGIPEQDINKIFQPFYTTKEAGTGLGLAISYGIIRGHGGEIEVKSEAGKGTTFSVYLPVVSARTEGIASGPTEGLKGEKR